MTLVAWWLVTYALVQVDADADVEGLVPIVALFTVAKVRANVIPAVFPLSIAFVSFSFTFIFGKVTFHYNQNVCKVNTTVSPKCEM